MASEGEGAPFKFQLAPDQLWQAINPWTWNVDSGQIGLINVNIGATSHPETERTILDEVGSYGKQLGHIGDALEVLIRHFEKSGELDGISSQAQGALDILKGEMATIRKIKDRTIPSKVQE